MISGSLTTLLVPAISSVDKAFGVDGCLKQPKELSIRFVGNGKYVNVAVTASH